MGKSQSTHTCLEALKLRTRRNVIYRSTEIIGNCLNELDRIKELYWLVEFSSLEKAYITYKVAKRFKKVEFDPGGKGRGGG